MTLSSIEHIHGFTDNRLVLGINDISQIKNEAFKTNQDIIETLVKNDYNKALKHTVEESCSKLISRSNVIVIFGASIGDTDKMWWELIGKRLVRQDIKLIVFEKTKPIPPNRENLIPRIERAVIKKFLGKTSLSDNEKSKAKENIYVGINTDFLDLKEKTSS